MKVRLLEIAEIELDEAVRWYEAQAQGLGDAFLVEFLAAADRVSRYPEAWQLVEAGVRRCRLNRFPYGLIYTIERSELVVLAIAHLHRKPGYWRDRVR